MFSVNQRFVRDQGGNRSGSLTGDRGVCVCVRARSSLQKKQRNGTAANQATQRVEVEDGSKIGASEGGEGSLSLSKWVT